MKVKKQVNNFNLFLIIFLFLVLSFEPVQASGDHPALKYGEMMTNDRQRGDFESVVSHGTDACKLYDQEGKYVEKIETLKEMSTAYIALGQYGKSVEVLEAALSIINKTKNVKLKATVLGIMGYASVNSGAIEQGQKKLAEGITLAREDKNTKVIAYLLGYQAKVHIMLKDYPKAIANCEEGMAISEKTHDASSMARFASDMATVYILTGNAKAGGDKIMYAYENYQKMGNSHEKAYGLIGLARKSQRLSTMLPDRSQDWVLLAGKALSQAEVIASSIGDYRSATYAYGYLGQLYENDRRYQEALQLTKKAIFSARQIRAWEVAYLWEWQQGRIYRSLGETDQAISAYEQALDTLNSVRQEMLACSRPAGQSSSLKTIEPIYFQLADLLLKRAESSKPIENGKADLMAARTVIESLKTVELQNYFQDPCIVNQQMTKKQVEEVAEGVLVVYSIIFKDRVVLLISGKFGIKMISIPVDAKRLAEEVNAFRLALESPQNSLHIERSRRIVQLKERLKPLEYLSHAQKIYDWIFRPLEQDLALRKIKTIIFIPDGILRTIPMAALHDGKQYVIEKISLVTVPSLSLTDPNPIARGKVEVIIGGVSKGIYGFAPLDSVNGEIEAVKNIYGGKVLKNENFTKQNLTLALKEVPYQIIHIATHGEFTRDISDSYLLAWDGKIDMNQIDRIIRVTQYRKTQVELITLSACQTAAEDERAALGLAGVAVKAGARSALATLWNVSDQVASEVVIEFYRQLQQPSVSKAQALQRAQTKILNIPQFSHPFYWSPFLLIGNWL